MANLFPLIDELFKVFLTNTCNRLYFCRPFIYLMLFNVNILQLLYQKSATGRHNM